MNGGYDGPTGECSEQVYIHYVDFSGNTYTYTMPEYERKHWCERVGTDFFNVDVFNRWYDNWSPNDPMAMHDEGRINLRAVAHIRYTVQEVH